MDIEAKAAAWRSGAPPSRSGGLGGVPRLTLEELIATLSPVTHTPHETLAAAVHLVVAGRVYLVEPEPDGPAAAGPAESPAAAGRRAARSSARFGKVLALGALLAAALLAAGGVALASDPPGGVEPQELERSCAEDALGRRFCAPDASGAAVSDALGRILCARGACVESDGDWYCSPQPGGAAAISREGAPECDGGCVAPDATLCEEV